MARDTKVRTSRNTPQKEPDPSNGEPPLQQIQTQKPEYALSLRESKLIEWGLDIYDNPPSSKDMAFSHAIFCQVGLPRSRVEDREFLRQSGDAWINIQAGYLDEGTGPIAQPIPYGALPSTTVVFLFSCEQSELKPDAFCAILTNV